MRASAMRAYMQAYAHVQRACACLRLYVVVVVVVVVVIVVVVMMLDVVVKLVSGAIVMILLTARTRAARIHMNTINCAHARNAHTCERARAQARIVSSQHTRARVRAWARTRLYMSTNMHKAWMHTKRVCGT